MRRPDIHVKKSLRSDRTDTMRILPPCLPSQNAFGRRVSLLSQRQYPNGSLRRQTTILRLRHLRHRYALRSICRCDIVRSRKALDQLLLIANALFRRESLKCRRLAGHPPRNDEGRQENLLFAKLAIARTILPLRGGRRPQKSGQYLEASAHRVHRSFEILVQQRVHTLPYHPLGIVPLLAGGKREHLV